MIAYRGALTEEDAVAGLRLSRRVLPEGGTARDGALWLGLALFALPVWVYFSGLYRDPEAFWWLPFSLLWLAAWWRRRSRSLQTWRNAIVGKDASGVVTEAALETRLAGLEARIPWEFFSCRLATSRTLLLFANPRVQVVLSARQFQGDDAWQRANDLIGQHVPEPERRSLFDHAGLWFFLLVVFFLAWHFARIKMFWT